MKKLLLISVLCCPLTSALCSLIDLTPGGVVSLTAEVVPFYREATFFDQAAHGYFSDGYLDGWVSRYGSLNGGTYFFTDLIGHDESFAHVSWDMSNAPGGYWMSLLYVTGIGPDGSYLENWYAVPHQEWFVALDEIVTVNRDYQITGISFYGRNRVPDGGNTLGLLFLGAVIMAGGVKCVSMSGRS